MTLKEFREAMGWTLGEVMRFLDAARRYSLVRYPELFESTNLDDWELPESEETPEQWAERHYQVMRNTR